MKLSQIVLFLSSTLMAGCQTQEKASDLEKMLWLLGNWKGEANGQPFYEHWSKISNIEFDNVNYSICNGDTVRDGHSKIEIRNGRIAYTSDNKTWYLKELNDSLIIFENNQYGEKFAFSHTPKGEWRANLKYPGTQVEYLLAKTKSISDLLLEKPIPMTGYYEGYIEFMGKKLLTSINFEYKDSKQIATTSTPDNLQLNMPFNQVCYNPPFLKLTIRDGIRNLELSAKLGESTITGNLTGEIPATILLKKAGLSNNSKNYSVVPLKIQNGNVTLPANLFLPNSQKPTAAVIMVCGSGQHIKEEYNGWADLLASKGVAVLTYDKRNVTNFPNLKIRQASSDIVLPGELESDIEAAISILKNRKEINPEKIGLFGFSQGAVIAPIVATKNKNVAFIVAVSGNATTDEEFIINQAINRLKQRNFDEDAIKKTREICEALFKYTKDKKDGVKIQKSIDMAYEMGFGQYALPRQLPNDDEIKYLSTWNSFEHDPSKYWSKLGIPSYVVYGDSDIFIPVKESVKILDSLFQYKPDILTMKVYSNSDHFIKQVPDRSNFDFPKYTDRYISDLTEWIIKQAE